MAKLTSMPHQAIIDGFKGVVDFYLWMGIPVARKWPKSPGHLRAPAVMAQWERFAWAAKSWAHLPVEVKEAYNQLAQGTRFTGRDLHTRAVIKGDFVYNP